MKPSIGRIVHYKLTESDAQDINRRRHDFSAFSRMYDRTDGPGNPGATGHVGHFGNAVRPGDVFPAMIVKVWHEHPESGVNLQVHLDGSDAFWATSRKEGEGQGEWSFPVTIKAPEMAVDALTPEQIQGIARKVQEALLRQARRNKE